MLYVTQKTFEHGNKAGRLLAYITRAESTPISIPRILTSMNQISDVPQDITDAFLSFYRDLYTSRADYSETQLSDYLDQITLPRLKDRVREELEEPLSVEELTLAISQMPAHKSPGLDGFPVEWYKQFQHLLGPLLLKTYNEALKEGRLPPSMREALIVLLLKPRKDPLKCDSYRPISLINVDAKILAKALANRLNKVIARLVGSDQGGFIPGRSTRMNIRRLFHNLSYTHDCPSTRAVVSLDTCKAFDSVEWPYLFRVLQLYGFGPRLIAWI